MISIRKFTEFRRLYDMKRHSHNHPKEGNGISRAISNTIHSYEIPKDHADQTFPEKANAKTAVKASSNTNSGWYY